GSVNLRDGFIPGVQATPPAFVESFPITVSASQSINVFNPDISIPYVQSWSLSVQREITPSTVVEVRYVGNHGTGLWRQYDLNQVNIFENGFLQEFLNAKSNLDICQANLTACGGTASFANNGLPGQVALPIMEAAFRDGPGDDLSGNFTDSAFISNLNLGLPGSFANSIQGSFAAWTNLTTPSTGFTAVFPRNFFVLNPDARGGSWLFTNDTHTRYDGMTVEVRRRLSGGLQITGNYTWSKGLGDSFNDSSSSGGGFSNYRDRRYNRGPSPFDIRHAFKMNAIYELPFGPGKRWSTSNAILGRIIGGWELSTITRWQSGRVFLLSGGEGGTVNQNDGGVELIGTTRQQIQDSLSIRKMPDGTVFWFPEALIGSNGQA
ncbi:MAG TPA: hypothetical protein VLD18_13320, partial [Verrucomicrobiae bacterium]|nr:hypothetical protein [Verrucomicrobiae bacterium]